MDNDRIEFVDPPDPKKQSSPFHDSEPEFEAAEVEDNDCYYNSKKYSNDALICMCGKEYQCSYGSWINKHKDCKSQSSV